jgi:hypothetical protein
MKIQSKVAAVVLGIVLLIYFAWLCAGRPGSMYPG